MLPLLSVHEKFLVLTDKLVSVVWILFVLKDYANKVDTSESQGRDRMPVQLDSCSTQGLPHVPK